MIKKAVLTAAGLGTRLLPMSKELPKEMLPIFVKGKNGLILKPMLQALFEQLYDFGIKEFCFIVGRGKRAIEDHFTPDYSFLKELFNKGKTGLAEELKSFYDKIENSRIVWVNQPQPKGFGDAVLKAEGFISNEDFMVSAGDTYIVSKNGMHLKRLLKVHSSKHADASILVMEVPNPKQYGVIEAIVEGECLKVLSAVEKPTKPKSKLAIMPFYVFKPIIFEVLKSLKPGVGGEIQLTDAINKLIELGNKVYAINLYKDEYRLDIGTPKTYWEAIKLSYKLHK